LAILLFALPNFIDVEWRGQTIARIALVFFAAGTAVLIAGFLGPAKLIAFGGCVVFAALLVYLATAFATVAAGLRGERIPRAVARAFGITLAFLLFTALLGLGLAFMLAGKPVGAWISATPPAHAALGTFGWISMLIFGVSMRTLRPITGDGTRMRWMHIAVGSFALAGIPLLAAGVASHVSWLSWIGGGLFAAGAFGYVLDVLDIVRRAVVPHRPPQAFVVASVLWLLCALVLGAGVLAGRPWEDAYIFVLLAGWAGQMVNAHMYHIGVRLIATVYRGEDDETRPQEILDARLSWFSFVSMQIAIVLVAVSLLNGSAGLAARGAVFGIGAWIAIVANMFGASLRARVLPRTIRL
jgi:hypothetical protein